jgi:hypothetical protein
MSLKITYVDLKLRFKKKNEENSLKNFPWKKIPWKKLSLEKKSLKKKSLETTFLAKNFPWKKNSL